MTEDNTKKALDAIEEALDRVHAILNTKENKKLHRATDHLARARDILSQGEDAQEE